MIREPLFDAWPQRIMGATIEPGSGQVRIKPVVGTPIWLELPDVRELAAATRDSRRRSILLAAVCEATRQDAVRHAQMDGRV